MPRPAKQQGRKQPLCEEGSSAIVMELTPELVETIVEEVIAEGQSTNKRKRKVFVSSPLGIYN
jgi:hypothetical protein